MGLFSTIQGIISTALQFMSGVASPTISQQQALSGAGQSLTVQAQASATGSAAVGGDLILQPGAGDGAGTHGNIFVRNPASTTYFRILTNDAAAVQTAQNIQLNGPTIFIQDSAGNTVKTYNNNGVGSSNEQISNTVTAWNLNWQALASTSAASGSAGIVLTLQGQNGQAATGATHNGGAGGDIALTAGIGGISGSATAGIGGSIKLTGGQKVQQITVTGTYTVDTNSTTADYLIFTNPGAGAAFTITIPSAVTFPGRVLKFKDVGGSAGTKNITLSPSAGQIDGAATYVLNINRAGIEITSDGTNWNVTGEYNGTVI